MVRENTKEILKNTFGFNQFRPYQEEVVEHILEGRDVFVVMPTGGGKSLCFQLPAKILPGLTVVISPLISLMKDQVDGARENNISAMYLNSSLLPYEMARVYQYLREGQLDILYISPERLAIDSFYQTLRQLKISLFAVDEAHCISEWGHDFRPDYMNLSRLIADFPAVPVAAFTATATMKVQQDIIERIGLRSPLLIRASFNRPNLYYHVARKENVQAQVLDYIRRNPGKPGIVYRTTRKAVTELSAFLVQHGIKALPYHAGLTADERERNQDAFNKDEVDIITATIAFGMGIDKSNARFVIHADLPKNMEGYYQETGRVGRDGDDAECLLFFSYKDIPKLRFFIGQITDPGEQKIAESKLYDMIRFAVHNVCRRKTLLAYFGETYEKENCGNCDICNGEHAQTDISRDAQIVMSAIMRTGQHFGIRHIIDIVSGADTQRIRQYSHDALPTYGAGKEKPKKHWSFIIDELLSQEAIIQTDDQYPVLKISVAGKNILFGKEKIYTLVQPERINAPGDAVIPNKPLCDEILFEQLRLLRRSIAREHEVPPYIIFSDKTLREMACYMPVDPAALGRIGGVGEFKLKNYGLLFLECIKAYKEKRPGNVQDVPPGFCAEEESKSAKKKRSQGDSLLETLSLLKQGLSVDAIAGQRKMAVSTVIGHLEECLKADACTLAIDNYISADKGKLIEGAFRALKTWKLTPVINLLKNRVTFDEVRIVRGFMQGKGITFDKVEMEAETVRNK